MVESNMMDTTKFKSVALPIEAYEMAKELAKENERSIARQISFLIRRAKSDSCDSVEDSE